MPGDSYKRMSEASVNIRGLVYICIITIQASNLHFILIDCETEGHCKCKQAEARGKTVYVSFTETKKICSSILGSGKFNMQALTVNHNSRFL